MGGEASSACLLGIVSSDSHVRLFMAALTCLCSLSACSVTLGQGQGKQRGLPFLAAFMQTVVPHLCWSFAHYKGQDR